MKSYRAARWFLMIPPWVFAILLKPALPSDHPWKKCKFTLRSWVDFGTELSMEFGLLMWFALELVVCLIWIIWKSSSTN